jgi:hypothetical protein
MSTWDELIEEIATRGAARDDGWTPAITHDYTLTDGTRVRIP